MPRLFPITLFLFLCTCSGTPSAESDGGLAEFRIDTDRITEYPAEAMFDKLSAVELLDISPDDDHLPIIGHINQVKVFSDKSLLAFDSASVRVHHFDPEGNYLKSFGRSGNGPGEFSKEATIQLYQDEVYLFERLQYKIERFSNLDGEWVQTETIPIENIGDSIPLSLYKVDDEHLWMRYRFLREHQHGYRESVYHVVAVDRTDTESAQTELATLPSMSLMTENLDGFIATYPTPYSPQPVASLTSENEIILARTDTFLFYRINPVNNTTIATTLPVAPIRLTPEEKESFTGFNERIHQLARDHMPETRPAVISRVIPDRENGFWAGYQINDRATARWLYFNSEGTILFETDLPLSFLPHVYEDGIMYGLASNESGVHSIKAYQIQPL